jgi:hypothetical protein
LWIWGIGAFIKHSITFDAIVSPLILADVVADYAAPSPKS